MDSYEYIFLYMIHRIVLIIFKLILIIFNYVNFTLNKNLYRKFFTEPKNFPSLKTLFRYLFFKKSQLFFKKKNHHTLLTRLLPMSDRFALFSSDIIIFFNAQCDATLLVKQSLMTGDLCALFLFGLWIFRIR